MIKTELFYKGFDLDQETTEYLTKKIAKLDRYLSRHEKKSVHAEIKLRREGGNKVGKSMVEVILHMPNQRLTAKETSEDLKSGIDVVEEKLVTQLRKHKEIRSDYRLDAKRRIKALRKFANKDFWSRKR